MAKQLLAFEGRTGIANYLNQELTDENKVTPTEQGFVSGKGAEIADRDVLVATICSLLHGAPEEKGQHIVEVLFGPEEA